VEKDNKRSVRRHQQRKAWVKIAKRRIVYPVMRGRFIEDITVSCRLFDMRDVKHFRHRAGKEAATPCQCSCPSCANPRRHFGNAKQSLTRAELRAKVLLREGLAEL